MTTSLDASGEAGNQPDAATSQPDWERKYNGAQIARPDPVPSSERDSDEPRSAESPGHGSLCRRPVVPGTDLS